MRKLGRAGRQRRQHRQGQTTQGRSKADSCADLKKWMISRSTKKDLIDTFRLVPFHFPETGRGLKTKKAISPGSIIVSIPQCLMVTPKLVLDSHIGPTIKSWGRKFTPQQLLALFLVVERHRASTSEWQPFIQSLPVDYSLPHYLSSNEISLLPQHVALTAHRLKQRAHDACKQVLQFCSSQWENAEEWASWEIFRWAWCSANSRGVFLDTEAGIEEHIDLSEEEENSMALCPYLDLLNHSITARVHAGMNYAKGCYDITTDDTHAAHEQIFISYGAHDNVMLFLHYGFVLPNNPYNKMSFSLNDFFNLKDTFQLTNWEQKMESLHKQELHRGLNCTIEGMSWNLQAAFKILAMDWTQLQNSERAVTGDQLPPDIETAAKRLGKHFIHHLLQESQAALSKCKAGGVGQSLHKAMVERLILDEVDILSATLRNG